MWFSSQFCFQNSFKIIKWFNLEETYRSHLANTKWGYLPSLSLLFMTLSHWIWEIIQEWKFHNLSVEDFYGPDILTIQGQSCKDLKYLEVPVTLDLDTWVLFVCLFVFVELQMNSYISVYLVSKNYSLSSWSEEFHKLLYWLLKWHFRRREIAEAFLGKEAVSASKRVVLNHLKI